MKQKRKAGRVYRGGGCYNDAARCSAAYRSGVDPGCVYRNLGFRCARSNLAAFVELDRVFRCGNANLHSTFRFSGAPDTTDNDLGFRCARRRKE